MAAHRTQRAATYPTRSVVGASLLMAFAMGSCGDDHTHNRTLTPDQEQGGQQHSHADHAFTNEHSVEEMAHQFESPERDSTQKPQEVVRLMGDLHGKTVMDIGAGTGYFAVRFAAAGAHVIAADVSDQFQAYLKQRLESDGIVNVELRKTPYGSPLLRDAEADIVFIANTYHHIENRTDYFAKVKRGLKETGELVVVDYFRAELPKEIQAPPMEMRVSVDEAMFELRKAGFTSFHVELDLLPFQYILKAR